MFALATHERRIACRLFTLTAIVCLVTPSLGVRLAPTNSLSSPSQSPAEEHETHSIVRCQTPRQSRLRFVPVKSVALRRDVIGQSRLHSCWPQPRPQFLPCLIGSGIRLLC